MDVLGWLIVWLGVNFVVSLIAGMRRGASSGVTLFLINCGLSFALIIVTSWGLGGDIETKMWALPLVACLVLLGAFMWALTAPNAAQLAETLGEHGDLKKCPFCAEAVKREAIKCKHCGSNLATAG